MSKAAVSIQRRGKDRNGDPHEITEIKTSVIPRVGDYVRLGGAGLRLVTSVICEYGSSGDRYVVELE